MAAWRAFLFVSSCANGYCIRDDIDTDTDEVINIESVADTHISKSSQKRKKQPASINSNSITKNDTKSSSNRMDNEPLVPIESSPVNPAVNVEAKMTNNTKSSSNCKKNKSLLPVEKPLIKRKRTKTKELASIQLLSVSSSIERGEKTKTITKSSSKPAKNLQSVSSMNAPTESKIKTSVMSKSSSNRMKHHPLMPIGSPPMIPSDNVKARSKNNTKSSTNRSDNVNKKSLVPVELISLKPLIKRKRTKAQERAPIQSLPVSSPIEPEEKTTTTPKSSTKRKNNQPVNPPSLKPPIQRRRKSTGQQIKFTIKLPQKIEIENIELASSCKKRKRNEN